MPIQLYFTADASPPWQQLALSVTRQHRPGPHRPHRNMHFAKGPLCFSCSTASHIFPWKRRWNRTASAPAPTRRSNFCYNNIYHLRVVLSRPQAEGELASRHVFQSSSKALPHKLDFLRSDTHSGIVPVNRFDARYR